MKISNKIFNYAKISVVIQIFLTIIISIYYLFELSTRSILFKNGFYLASTLYLIVAVIITLAFIKIGQERKNKAFTYLLYGILLIALVDFIISFQNITLFTAVFLWISGFVGVVLGFFFISLSNYYKYLKKIGILVVIENILEMVTFIIPEETSFLLSIFTILIIFLVLGLTLAIQVFEFKLFSYLSKIKNK